MTSFWRIFSLELTSLVRSKALALLTLAALGWMVAFPHVACGDGTDAGAREIALHFSLGGVFLLTVISLLATATGSIAGERDAKRLQLTLVRPVRYAVIFLAKAAALTSAGAAVLALACLVALATQPSAPCHHVLRPVLPSPREEAKAMYATYMADPETPEAVKTASKAAVLRLLENRAIDHYATLETNQVSTWRFDLAHFGSLPDELAVSIRFSNQYDLRRDVLGEWTLGDWHGTVSNITQAVVSVPLTVRGGARAAADELTFLNRGTSALMMRPRKDLELHIPADAFGWNLLRAYGELVAILALLVSFGLFLSAALSRPVAMFVAIVTLTVGEMSPSVVEQYPDELEAKTVDRIGLVLTRFSAEVTRPVSSLDPLARLSRDVCIEPCELVRVFAIDFVFAPLLLALLAALVLPRKNETA